MQTDLRRVPTYTRRRLLVVFIALAAMIMTALPAGAHRATHQSSEVYTFAAMDDVGDASLVRSDSGVSVNLSADDLDAGVYTMWWVIWNNPEDCGTPWACLDTDFGNPVIQVAIGYAGGANVGPNGNVNIGAHLGEGHELSGFPTEYGITPTDTLDDSRHAEVHVVLRYHGEKVAGNVSSMLHTFNGGCDYDKEGLDGTQPTYGTEGSFDCEDTHFAIFPSENTP